MCIEYVCPVCVSTITIVFCDDCDRCEEAQGPYRYIDKVPCWNCSNKPNQ